MGRGHRAVRGAWGALSQGPQWGGCQPTGRRVAWVAGGTRGAQTEAPAIADQEQPAVQKARKAGNQGEGVLQRISTGTSLEEKTQGEGVLVPGAPAGRRALWTSPSG